MTHPDDQNESAPGGDLCNADISSRRFTRTSISFGICQGFILSLFLTLAGAPIGLAVVLGVLNSVVGMFVWRRLERQFLVPYAQRVGRRWVERHGSQKPDEDR